MSIEPSAIEHLYRSFRVCVGYAIRTAEEKDLPAVEWLRRVTDTGPVPGWVQEDLLNGKKPILLAELSGHPIGQIQMKINGEAALLDGLRVLEPMRGLGVAQHLVDEAEKCCVRCGCKFTRISVSSDNEDARELFRIMGYALLEGDLMEKDIRWKSCHVAPEDDIPAEELCRNDIDSAIG